MRCLDGECCRRDGFICPDDACDLESGMYRHPPETEPERAATVLTASLEVPTTDPAVLDAIRLLWQEAVRDSVRRVMTKTRHPDLRTLWPRHAAVHYGQEMAPPVRLKRRVKL